MKIHLLAFGLAKDIVGQQRSELEVAEGITTDELQAQLIAEYPEMGNTLSIRLAVNEEYVLDAVVLNDGDEVALIPPVSGG
ncbi:MAG: molybdopterin converting factor subunit 1 [Flavobacteriales bacterium]|nr:molybdopterin converting factor subunit 1 [Flavobacteriales bacterium]MDG1779868.1 molybdopterin converting factor subunit 1 [Flavobacteriales bacterium]